MEAKFIAEMIGTMIILMFGTGVVAECRIKQDEWKQWRLFLIITLRARQSELPWRSMPQLQLVVPT